MKHDNLEVHGSLLKGFAEACVNLSIVAGIQSKELVHNIDPTGWYPLSHFAKLQQQILQSYRQPKIILETVGAMMMQMWYKYGPGKQFVDDGIGFLHFQSGSDGFSSVVKGPKDLLGSFELSSIDTKKGKAVINSTTPFDKALERGVIIGGMLAPGDIAYIEVDNSKNPNIYLVEFKTGKALSEERATAIINRAGKPSLKLTEQETVDLIWWQKGLQQRLNKAQEFWQATNKNLSHAYEKLDQQNKEVGRIFYKAGMADAAADVIHNIGNSINSVVTAVGILSEILHQSKVEELIQIQELLVANEKDLAGFLSEDPKGKKIIEYLQVLSSSLLTDKLKSLEELQQMSEGAHNVQKILDAQRSYLKASSVMEKFNAINILEDALNLLSRYLELHEVEIIKHYSAEDIVPIEAHQSKLISILMEVIKNSTEAMIKTKLDQKKIEIVLKRDEETVVLDIIDNGEGIPVDHMNKVFNHGFTTKDGRYGFGLHNCANYISDMGGTIKILHSSAKKGTTIRLELATV